MNELQKQQLISELKTAIESHYPIGMLSKIEFYSLSLEAIQQLLAEHVNNLQSGDGDGQN